jgi:glycosyltransferase involved in cell wall biosynthesis
MTKLKILSVSAGKIAKNDAQSWRIVNLVSYLNNKGNTVKSITFLKNILPSSFVFDKLTFNGIPLFNPTFLVISLNAVRRFNPDIIIAHTHHPTIIMYLLQNLGWKSTPLVFDMHGFLVAERILLSREKNIFSANISILFDRFIETIAVYAPSKILCVSRKAIYYLIETFGLGYDKLIHVPNGVDLEFFKPKLNDKVSLNLKKSLGFDGKFVFGYVGGFQPWQGVENLIRAAFMESNKKMGFLIIGGKGSWRKGNVLKLKQINRTDVPHYYSICDVLVLPRPIHIANEVASPTKFAEYTAMGKPVLVTNVGDPAELTKKYRCGIILPDNNPNTLRTGFNNFIEISEDDLKKMGENSRKLAEEEFDWVKIIENLNSELIKLKKS